MANKKQRKLIKLFFEILFFFTAMFKKFIYLS